MKSKMRKPFVQKAPSNVGLNVDNLLHVHIQKGYFCNPKPDAQVAQRSAIN